MEVEEIQQSTDHPSSNIPSSATTTLSAPIAQPDEIHEEPFINDELELQAQATSSSAAAAAAHQHSAESMIFPANKMKHQKFGGMVRLRRKRRHDPFGNLILSTKKMKLNDLGEPAEFSQNGIKHENKQTGSSVECGEDDELIFYYGGDDDGDDDSADGYDDDEDSNAEQYYKNDYPDEEVANEFENESTSEDDYFDHYGDENVKYRNYCCDKESDRDEDDFD